MLTPALGLSIWLYRRPVDMRKSYDGLIALARGTLGENPLGGALFVFVNRRRTQMKCLYFAGDGYCIWAKRLERGRFEVAFSGEDRGAIDAVTLRLLIDGVAADARRLRRYSLPSAGRPGVQ
jgi:transposase